jgi:proteasome lid subunit RPN8/RPN11
MTTPVVHLPEELRRQIIEHCLSELPNEGCGLVAMDGESVTWVYPTGNDLASPTGYTIPPQAHVNSLFHAEGSDWRLGGVFHSHPDGSAEMSSTDVRAALDPDWVYLVVGLEGKPDIRGWQVHGGTVEKVLLA